MTNKEAKEKLYMEWQKFLEDNIDYAGISEAYKIAFKALEQEPCEDCISREAVLDLAKKGILVSNGNYKSVCKAINDLPSVKPKERTGEWQQDMDGTFLCSECGSGYKDQPTLMGKPMFAFCPICGCRMIKGADE